MRRRVCVAKERGARRRRVCGAEEEGRCAKERVRAKEGVQRRVCIATQGRVCVGGYQDNVDVLLAGRADGEAGVVDVGVGGGHRHALYYVRGSEHLVVLYLKSVPAEECRSVVSR